MIDDGTFALGPGRIAGVVTYLEMPIGAARPVVAAGAGPAGARFDAIGPDPERYRALFREVGENWLWFSRLRLSDEALLAIIAHPRVEAAALVREGRDIGLLELDFREPGACEVAVFGLVPDAVGAGFGRQMMERAIARASEMTGIERLWLHTCTLDHPGAVDFYRRMGFRPYRRGIEIDLDPRLDGTLPREAAPWLPVIEA